MSLPAQNSATSVQTATKRPLRRVVAYANPKIPGVIAVLEDMLRWGAGREVAFLLPRQMAERLNKSDARTREARIEVYDPPQMAHDGDGADPRQGSTTIVPDGDALMVCLGGDGTLIHGIRHFWPLEAPVLGVNLGYLSFNAACEPAELPGMIEGWLADRLSFSEHLVLTVRLIRGDEVLAESYAVNDVVLRQSGNRLIHLALRQGDELVSSFAGDGLIVATPIGSTAYNLSAGGPIVYPTLRAVTATGICPHTLAFRAVVLAPEPEITMHFDPRHGRRDALLLIDGQERWPISAEDLVQISAAPTALRLARRADLSYFARLREKLFWRGEMHPPEPGVHTSTQWE